MIDKNKWKEIYSVPSDKVLSEGIEIFEMATPLKKYINRVENLRIQIVENWCLCKYCQMFDPSNCNFNHWKGELHGYLKDLSGFKLKNGIDKKKHVIKLLIDEHEFNDPSWIKNLISEKFEIEGIFDDDVLNSVSVEFSSGILDLIDAICDSTIRPIHYIEEEFEIGD